MAGHPMFEETLKELQDLHDRKNHDYAGDNNPMGNLEMCEMGGVPAWKGVIIRLTDKMARLLSFARKGELQVKDESVEDTFKDMAIYAVLGLILYRTRSRSRNDTRSVQVILKTNKEDK